MSFFEEIACISNFSRVQLVNLPNQSRHPVTEDPWVVDHPQVNSNTTSPIVRFFKEGHREESWTFDPPLHNGTGPGVR